MAAFLFDGRCLDESVIKSVSVQMPLPFSSDSLHYVAGVSASIYHPDSNYYLLRGFTLLNYSDDSLWYVKNTLYGLAECEPSADADVTMEMLPAIMPLILLMFVVAYGVRMTIKQVETSAS